MREHNFGPELSEPSTVLKDEFRHIIDANIPDGDETATFMHPDYRIFSIIKPSPNFADHNALDIDKQHAVVIQEDIEVVNGDVIDASINYSIDFLTDEATKSEDIWNNNGTIFRPQSFTPEEVAERARLESVRDQLIHGLVIRGYSDADVNHAVSKQMAKYIGESPLMNDSFARALSAYMEGHKMAEEFGIRSVSGVELQGVLADLLVAIEYTKNNKTTGEY